MVNLLPMLAEVAVKADEADRTVLEQLDPQRRVAVVLALLGLVLLGVLLVVVALLAGRWARHDRPTLRPRQNGDSASPSKGTAAPPSSSRELRSGETLYEPPGEGETKV